MNKILTFSIAFVVGSALASAAILSPEQALDRALSQSLTSQMRAAASNELTLVNTTVDPVTGATGVYVFAADDQPGFIVASANDDFQYSLLGYSTTSTFDPANIPPQMQWWLNAQAEVIAKSSTSTPRLLKAKAADLEQIPPMVDAIWNQSSPFNKMCPTVNGQRCVTGCVATAIAQIMNVHHWPKKGQGGSVTLSGMTINFNESVYDWDHMKDSYNNSYTTTEANAVAKLMVDCGFASNMNYSPNGSGASDFTCGQGLLKYFNYDKHLQYVQRNWFSDQEWKVLIHSELAAGRPVMLCGDDGEVGHAFVCDGYQGNDMFHINWGWGGYYNGYFLLTDLDPEGTGIGGGSGDTGYNRNNSALIGIDIPQDGHEVIPTMFVGKTFAADRTAYNRTAGTLVGFVGDYYSVALTDLNIILGVKCVDSKGNETYIVGGAGEIKSGYGVTGYDVTATEFPVGEYDVYPAATTYTDYLKGIWYPIYTDNSTLGYAHFKVTNDKINVTGDLPDPEITAWVESTNPEGRWYRGVDYDVTLNLESNVAYSGPLYLILYKSNTLYSYSETPVAINIEDPSNVYQYTWNIEIPADITLGRYTLALASESNGALKIIENSNIGVDIADDPSQGVAAIDGVLFVGSSSRGTTKSRPAVIPFDGDIKVGVSCSEGTWNETLAGVLLDVDSDEPLGQTNLVPLTIEAGASATTILHVDANESEELEAGVTYQFVPVAVNRGPITSKNKYYVKFTGELGGIQALNPDNDAVAPVHYYNLQGIEVNSPAPGQLLIRRQGTRTDKIIY